MRMLAPGSAGQQWLQDLARCRDDDWLAKVLGRRVHMKAAMRPRVALDAQSSAGIHYRRSLALLTERLAADPAPR